MKRHKNPSNRYEDYKHKGKPRRKPWRTKKYIDESYEKAREKKRENRRKAFIYTLITIFLIAMFLGIAYS